MDRLEKVNSSDPKAMLLILEYLDATEREEKLTKREVKANHDEGITDPKRVAVQQEKNSAHRKLIRLK